MTKEETINNLTAILIYSRNIKLRETAKSALELIKNIPEKENKKEWH